MNNTDTSFYKWLIELERVSFIESGQICKINEKEAEKWYNEGFTPFQTFRETFEMENDTE